MFVGMSMVACGRVCEYVFVCLLIYSSIFITSCHDSFDFDQRAMIQQQQIKLKTIVDDLEATTIACFNKINHTLQQCTIVACDNFRLYITKLVDTKFG